jgi:hypothetical protein
LEPKRAAHESDPPPRERDSAALLAAIRNAAMQLDQTLRAVEKSVDLVWKTSRTTRG